MLETFIETRNYSKLSEAFARLANLPVTAPKMGLGYGNFGLGKTFALERIAANTHAILLRAVQTWSKKSFLEKLCLELSLDVSGGASRMYERIVDELLQNRRILIIDEIDALLRSQKFEVLELLRDIHDETNIVLFLIGMEEANAKLKKHRHFYSRIVEFVEFKPIVLDDVKRFCELSDKIKIEDDLCDYFAKKYPNLRQIRVLLIRLENAAKRNNLTACNLKTFTSLRIEEEGKAI
ncbi:MAG: AAA family ATPase [Campylobacteraceae bacterium]|jgi:DNA transposition AAA+ family ATPase|nr:AAA family ATPase [Campylobacteraceae bacterium]